MQFRHYTLRVRHDRGVRTIRTVAQSEDAARTIVCKSERCPASAIRRVYVGRIVGA